ADTPEADALRLALYARLGRPAADREPAARRLLARQNSDGGWGQAKGMASDAFATGQALYALAEAGRPTDDPPVRKARAFLAGARHLETYDPKPDAPSEYRGPYRPIETSVPGLRVSELLPGHARVARRFTLLRSLAHTGPCHDSGPQQLFTSFPTTVNKLKPDHPDLFAVVDRLRADPARPLPNNVWVPPIPYLGAPYLGPAHEPFAVPRDPNEPKFEVPNIGLT